MTGTTDPPDSPTGRRELRQTPDEGVSSSQDCFRLYGFHTVEAALRNPARKIMRLCATENAERRLADALAARQVSVGHVPVERVSPRDLDRLLTHEAVHQGVLIETEPLPEPALADLAAAANAGGPLVVLDQVTDPHNAGAVLRSAAAFGASGLVMHRRHSPPLDGVLAKSASGALDLVPVALVTNLAQALAALKDQGVLLLGLSGDGTHPLEDEPLTGGLAFVLGAEGKGLRQLTRQTCDRLCRIATLGPLTSLNVSNAAAVTLHLAALRRRRGASGDNGQP